MDGGTLIGLLLNHSPMPWNDDIDTLIDIENKDKAIRLLLRTGGHIMKSFYDGRYSKLWDIHQHLMLIVAQFIIGLLLI